MKKWISCIFMILYWWAYTYAAPADTIHIHTDLTEAISRKKTLLSDICTTHFAVSAATAFATDVTAVQILKHTTHRQRPDGSSGSAMPSRHAAWAWGLCGSAAVPLSAEMAWSAPALQLGASAISMQRVISGRHHPSDVVAGMGIGLGSAAFGEWISSLICGRRYAYPRLCSIAAADTDHALWVSTGITFSRMAHGAKMQSYCTAITADIISRSIVDYTAAVGLSSYQCFTEHEQYMGEANALDLMGGIAIHNSSESPVSYRWDIMAGLRTLISDFPTNKFSAVALTKLGIYFHVTDHLCLGPTLSCSLYKISADTFTGYKSTADYGCWLSTCVLF